MSFVSIRCPNCAATESIPVGENQYKCRYCDNTFNYVDQNAPKVTKNITVQESNHCPICGRGVTSGTSNHCTICGTSDFCSNCVSETPEKKLMCKNCITTSLNDCIKCGKYSIGRCTGCVKLREKDPSHIISRCCSEHSSDYFIDHVKGGAGWYVCSNCGMVCKYCQIKGHWSVKCKFCGDKLVHSNFNPKYQNLKFSDETTRAWFIQWGIISNS